MKQSDFAVIGLGVTGFSVAKFLLAHGNKVKAYDVNDSDKLREKVKNELNLELISGRLELAYLAQHDVLVVSPGIDTNTALFNQLKSQGKKIIGDIELFAEFVTKPVIAITGSNGKSTVTSLVAKLLAASGLNVKVGGNLGEPALSLLDPKADVYVLELSSFQLETTYSLKPEIAIILNISPDHMDRYQEFAKYRDAKFRIYNNATTIIYNAEDVNTKPNALTGSNIKAFCLHASAPNAYGIVDSFSEKYFAKGNDLIIPVSKVKLTGLHNYSNIIAALTVVDSFNIPFAILAKELEAFHGLSHRCELVVNKQGVSWINDSKGTNVGATIATITGVAETISGKIVLLAGGAGKDQDFTPLKFAVEKFCKKIILFGKDKLKIKADLLTSVDLLLVETLQDAVIAAENAVADGDAVLLSPACASFDMFLNYAERGDKFKEIVRGRVL